MAVTANPTDSICLINGIPAETISVLDRGLAYGHGLFETIRVRNGDAPLLDYHLDRLICGLDRLSIPVEVGDVAGQLETLLSMASEKSVGAEGGDYEGVAKLIVTAGVGGRGYAALSTMSPSLIWQWHPLPTLPVQLNRSGIQVRLCDHRLPDNPTLAGLKHLNRLDQVLARAEWSDGSIHEGLMLDQHDHLIEGVSSNLFLRIGDEWVTPRLDRSGVSGVLRRLLLEKLCPELSVTCIERDVNVSELTCATELFVCNSLYGIRPVVKVIDAAEFSVGAWTSELQNTLKEQYPCYQI